MSGSGLQKRFFVSSTITYGDKRLGLPGGGAEPGETIHEAISNSGCF